MKVKRISNTSERITYNELKKGLMGTDNVIFGKLPIRDVIDNGIYSKLRQSDKKLFNTSHFDFVITDNNHNPLFAVEFDGPHHEIYKNTIKRDIRKNRICQIAEFPLIRITDVELEQYDSISILHFMIYRFVKWKEEYQRINDDIEEYINELSQEEFDLLTGDGIVDPSIDPSFRFDVEYPFPLINQVRNEIKIKYEINPFGSDKDDPKKRWYFVSNSGSGPSRDGTYYEKYSYGIYQGLSSKNRTSWNGGKILNKEINVLIENGVEFGMKWALIIDENYDIKEAPYLFCLREGYWPIYFSDIPGVSIPSICEAISEYLCYKKILEWAKKNIEKDEAILREYEF